MYRRLGEAVDACNTLPVSGVVKRVVGLVIEGETPQAAVGSTCLISTGDGRRVLAEIVGFRDELSLMMPLGDSRGISRGSAIRVVGQRSEVLASTALLGRVIDALGVPVDGGPPLTGGVPCQIYAEPVNPMQRVPIRTPLDLGVRSINALLTCGQGQRVGIFAGSGVGKSTLLGMMARYTSADVNVIALIGERGRELREFIEKDLGPAGLARSVVVVATSDQPALVRVRGAYVAAALAEWFSSAGSNVLFMMDSATRFALALREIGLAVGEPPATRGYTPSVFAALPRLLERSGNFSGGSITGLYTVLVEGDDMNEPVADAMRSILDGHIVLSRRLADAGIYPPVDILSSASRVMPDVAPQAQREAAQDYRSLTSVYRQNEDMITIGEYRPGGNLLLDRAVRLQAGMQGFLRQNIDSCVNLSTATSELRELLT